jgi:transcriptional antiterminator NusG
MSDENTPTNDETTTAPAEPIPVETPPPQLTTYAEPSDMAGVAADLPAEDASESSTEPLALPAAVEEQESEPVLEGEPEAPKPKKARKAMAAPDPSEPSAAPASTDPNAAPGDGNKKWYVIKIQSGREDSIKAAIERKVRIEGLEEFFGQIAIPVEEIVVKKSVKVKDKKTGDKVTQEKKVIKHQKKYPGYLFAEVEFNDRILYLFRETSGVGDFVGAGMKREPSPMTEREVQQMLTGIVGPGEQSGGMKGKQVVKLDFEKGDKVKIRDGPFANMEGEVKAITEAKEAGETPKVTVEVTIFGRGVPVELDYWHVDKV